MTGQEKVREEIEELVSIPPQCKDEGKGVFCCGGYRDCSDCITSHILVTLHSQDIKFANGEPLIKSN